MEIIVVQDKAAMSTRAAQIIGDLVSQKPTAVLGLATGSTPEGCYKGLIELHKNDGLDFSHVTSFNLDEYYPIDPSHKQSYRYFMNQKLFKHVNIKNTPKGEGQWGNTYLPYGLAENPEQFCRDYEYWIEEAGGIDLQLLGIGSNGHIAFNEPSSSLTSRTRVKALTQQTIDDNARFFNSAKEVPSHCITMGMGTIMDADRILMLATGEGKADAIADALEGPITAKCPASMLQLHPDAQIIVDKGAASKLKDLKYYIHVQKLMNKVKVPKKKKK